MTHTYMARLVRQFGTENSAGLLAAWRWLYGQLLADQERWLLWSPVGLGLGIGIYFALPAEPPLALGIGLSLICAWILIRAHQQQASDSTRILLAIPAIIVLGFAAAELRAWQVKAPVLAKRDAYQVTGRVVSLENRVKDRRLVLDRVTLEGLSPHDTPKLVRVTVRQTEPVLRIGDDLDLRAVLMAPPEPVYPGGYDIARHLYFQRIGAVGFTLGEPVVRGRHPPSTFQLSLTRLRVSIAETVAEVLPGERGAVAAALLTGLRGGIPGDVWTNMQRAGIAHLLALSGLHVGLVAGAIFLCARYGLMLTPALVVRIPAKKLAALCAMAAAFGYTLLAGATIPTQRACMMTGVALLAILLDRNPFSMRLVAFAATMILLFRPEALLSVSFQMSFAAVLTLIAAYETGAGPMARRRPAVFSLSAYVIGLSVTSVIASMATAPFAIFHFQRFALFGIVANLLAVPITGLIVMPAGLLALIAMPFGLHALPLHVMGIGIDAVLRVAEAVSAWPLAALNVPQPPFVVLLLISLGGIWLCLWLRAWRYGAIVPIALALVIWVRSPPPDLIISGRSDLVLVNSGEQDGRVTIAGKDRFAQSIWLETLGEPKLEPWPQPDRPWQDVRCDGHGCLLERHGWRIALSNTPASLQRDCRQADLVVTAQSYARCPNDSAAMLGWLERRRAGTIALWLTSDGLQRESVQGTRGQRPWVRDSLAR